MSKADTVAFEYAKVKGTLGSDYNQIYDAVKHGYKQAEKELIDKTIGWIGEIYNYHEIMRYSDSCESSLSELTEWFKNYMKEGGKDE